MVKEIPAAIKTMETIAPEIGPLTAKSNMADRDLGKDRSAVIDPNDPSCNDGKGTGKATFIPVLVAAIRCAISWTKFTESNPSIIGKHELNFDISLLFTTESKKLGLSAKEEIA
jgi:hypothetical protein